MRGKGFGIEGSRAIETARGDGRTWTSDTLSIKERTCFWKGCDTGRAFPAAHVSRLIPARAFGPAIRQLLSTTDPSSLCVSTVPISPSKDNARQPGWVEQPTAGRVPWLQAAEAAGILVCEDRAFARAAGTLFFLSRAHGSTSSLGKCRTRCSSRRRRRG